MNTTNNTILITGGSAGIGLEIAKLFSEKGNKVIITGRSKDRLDKALQQLPNAIGIQSDVSKEAETNELVEKIKSEYPDVNILINNAGAAYFYNLGNTENNEAYNNSLDEITTNYLSVIRLTEKLLPLLKQQSSSAIVNVTSRVAFMPVHRLPTYAASKAALHFYTQSLRNALNETSVQVYELMPPLVNTEFSTAIGGANGIPPKEVADELLSAFENNQFDVPVADTKPIYQAFKEAEETLKL